MTWVAGPTFTVTSAGLATAGAYLWLNHLSSSDAPVPLVAFFLVMGLASAALFYLLLYFGKHGQATSGHINLILGWGLLFRMIGLMGQPVYEDDFFRYLWDGRVFALIGNPYRHSPGHFLEDESVPENFQGILRSIRYAEVPRFMGLPAKSCSCWLTLCLLESSGP